MRTNYEYIVLSTVNVGGVRAYNIGDDIPAAAVENLGLVVGEHVRPAHANVIPRPARNAKVADWRAYALGQGVAQDEVEELTRAQLLERFPDDAPAPGEPPASVDVAAPGADNPTGEPRPDLVAAQATEQITGQAPDLPNDGDDGPQRPEARARKADWVEYAVALGMDRAEAEGLTAKELADRLPE